MASCNGKWSSSPICCEQLVADGRPNIDTVGSWLNILLATRRRQRPDWILENPT
jgi:hypothetical protein